MRGSGESSPVARAGLPHPSPDPSSPTSNRNQPPTDPNRQVGLHLLREYVFTHLEALPDKMNLLLAMLHKLYALVGPV